MQYTDTNKNALHLGDKKQVNADIDQLNSYNRASNASQIAQNLLEDPSLYSYDDYLDGKQKQQKQALIIRRNEPAKKKESQYLKNILEQSQRRKTEQILIQQKLNAAESKKLNLNEEVYISESFKNQLAEAKQFEQIDRIKEQINEKNKETNQIGILKSLYEQNQFQGGNRNFETKQVDTFNVIKQIIQENEPINEKEEKYIERKDSKSRSRSKEKSPLKEAVILESKEERLKKYKTRYLQRKEEDK